MNQMSTRLQEAVEQIHRMFSCSLLLIIAHPSTSTSLIHYDLDKLIVLYCLSLNLNAFLFFRAYYSTPQYYYIIDTLARHSSYY